MGMNAGAQPRRLPLVRWFGNWPPLRLGIVATVIVGGLGSLALPFARDSVELYRSGMQLWLAAAVVGYLLCIVLLEIRRSAADLQPLKLRPGAAVGTTNPFTLNRHPRALAAATIGGVAFGLLFNIYIGGLAYQMLAGVQPTLAYAWSPFVLVLLWALVFHAIWILLDNSFLLARIGEHDVRVDLNDPGALDVFANAGTRHLLLMVGGLAVFPIQGILGGGLEPFDLLPAVLIIAPVGLFLFAWPVLAVRRAITRAKRGELASIDAALAKQSHLSDRQLLLSLHRRQVAAIPAWPVSLRNLARVALYLVIPPLTWVAAAVVDTLVSRSL